jgi:DNA-binding transcriptional ArsR family regulator
MLRGGELCACQITAVLKLAPSTVSSHLAELRRAGLLNERKDGRWVHYRPASVEAAREILDPLWPQLARDTQIEEDERVLRQLRAVPVEQLCNVELSLERLSISRTERS